MATATFKLATPRGLGEERDGYEGPPTEADLRHDAADLLHRQIAAMNVDSFGVQPRRKLVEKYGVADAWGRLGEAGFGELAGEVARLPTELVDDDEEAKRFDPTMLRLQLCVLAAEPGFERLKRIVQAIAEALALQAAIPAIRDQMVPIEAMGGEEWWQDVTAPMLEVARRRLRALVKLIERGKKKIVYTDFEDTLGEGTELPPGAVGTGMDFERYKAKVRQFLVAHLDTVAIQKVRRNLALTTVDLAALEQVLAGSGIGTADHLARARDGGLGIFIRSLVGLEREAVVAALGEFVNDRSPSADQIEFVRMIVEQLTERGVMEPAALYESPFIDIGPHGPEDVFPEDRVARLITLLADIGRRAAA